MVLRERDVIRVVETDEQLLIFDVSDDALERAASIAGGETLTWMYSTEVLGNCGCPVACQPRKNSGA
jgi:hypothetical protein